MRLQDFAAEYGSARPVRAHMPGHKGKGDEINRYDITEIDGADSLYEASGIILESEERTSAVYDSQTLYSCGGSTLCIQTMLTMCVPRGGTVAAARGCHRAFLSACIMCGLSVKWIYPCSDEGASDMTGGEYDLTEIALTLDRYRPSCLYITSPDYLGRLAPIDDIARICHDRGVILAVDNAHGAYLRFVYKDGVPLHPMYHGADICCDSAHKTLPVLTGGAYLHMSDAFDRDRAKAVMSVYGSSSPSYLILRSLDLCTDHMEAQLSLGEESYYNRLGDMAQPLHECGIDTVRGEPGKLTLIASSIGYTGRELSDELRRHGIECEFADSAYTVLMLTGLDGDELSRIEAALKSIPRKEPFAPKLPLVYPHEKAMSLRDAFFAESESVPVSECAGRICSRAVTVCPPGIAVTVGGEVYREEDIRLLSSQGIKTVLCVKQP